MTFYELEDLIYDYREGASLETVVFGCECGCGGDSYTMEEWDQIMEHAEEAKCKLQAIGITFPEDSME